MKGLIMKIGIDIGGSHVASGLVGKNGELIAKETRDINISNLNEEKRVENLLLEIIDNEISNLLEKNDYTIGDISKIGIAVPGSPKDGKIRNLVNLHVKEFNLGEVLKKKYNVMVKIKNDGKCAGLAEKEYGSLKKYSDCIFLCIGTGVGSAVFLNSELLEPKNNPGFEFGHMVIEKNGKECNCGKKGCFETYASMKKFKAEAINEFKMSPDTVAEEVQTYIRQNIKKKNVNDFVDKYLENVSIGLSNIITIFEPEAISFGGSFSYYCDIFLPILNEKLKKLMFNKDSKVDLITAKLKNDAGMIGATEI